MGSCCLVDSEPWALLVEAPESSVMWMEFYEHSLHRLGPEVALSPTDPTPSSYRPSSKGTESSTHLLGLEGVAVVPSWSCRRPLHPHVTLSHKAQQPCQPPLRRRTLLLGWPSSIPTGCVSL